MKLRMLPSSSRYLGSSRYRCFKIGEKLSDDFDVVFHEAKIDQYDGNIVSKAVGIIKFHLRNIFTGMVSKKDDIIFYQKGNGPIGAYYSYNIMSFLGGKVIFDLDDAIFLEDDSVFDMIKTADIVFAGSHYLKEKSSNYNSDTYLIPTAVDTERHNELKEHYEKEEKVLGWVGSPSTLKYLSLIKEPLEELGNKHELRLVVIGANDHYDEVPDFENIELDIRDWELGKDWKQIEEFDVGLMPMENTEWERGKCAFKAIQYMCKGVPSVSSSVGEINYIVEDGDNGFLCENNSDWVQKLSKLIENPNLREKIGYAGRDAVEQRYDTKKTAKYISEIIENQFD